MLIALSQGYLFDLDGNAKGSKSKTGLDSAIIHQLLENGEYVKILDLLQSLDYKRHEQRRNVHLNIGLTYMYMKDYALARKAFVAGKEHAKSDDSINDSLMFLLELGNLCLIQGDYNGCLKANFDVLHKLYPTKNMSLVTKFGLQKYSGIAVNRLSTLTVNPSSGRISGTLTISKESNYD